MEMNNYVFNHLPIQGVTTIVTDYVYTSLFEFVTKYYTKYYNEFRGSEEQHINDSFFKVLNICKTEFGGFTITITANGEPQTFEQFKKEQKRHINVERLIIGF